MPPIAHSKIGASGASRWMNCAGSVRLNDLVEPVESGPYAAEGTAAHQFCEDCFRDGSDPYEHIGKTVDGFPVTKEMAAAADLYLDYLRDRSEELGVKPQIEQSFSLDWIDATMFGTSDAVIAQTFGMIEIIDFKYGAGVAVNVHDNPQLKYYALGVIGAYNEEGCVDVRLTVVQPRAHHADGPVRSFDMTVDDLNEWAAKELIPAVSLTYEPDAPLNTGDWCRFCDAQGQCPEMMGIATTTSLVTAADVFAEPVLPDLTTLTDAQLVKVYEFAGMLGGWIKKVQGDVKTRMLNGEKIDGLKVVAGRKTRKWSDDEAAEKKLKRLLGAAEAVNKTVLSPAQAEKKLGKDKTKISKMIESTTGSQIVPVSDKREALQIEDAASAFSA